MNTYFHYSARPLRAALLCAGLLAVCSLHAENASTTPAQALADEAVISLRAERGAAGQPLVVESAPRVRREIGAVIDFLPLDGGMPRVLGITPSRAAERIGLRAGDRLRRINGVDLGEAADPGSVVRQTLEVSPGALEFEIERDDEVLKRVGVADRVEIPGYRLEIEPLPEVEGCGWVSTFLKPPPSSGLFPLLLHEVDGRLGGALDSEVWRADAGQRRLKLSERIGAVHFQGRQNMRRGQLMRSEMFKYLEIDVQPNTKYHLAARFSPERREPINEQAYWEPVVWKETRETCR